MRRMLTFITGIWMATAGSALADQTVVVELFTSQGCSSCPPADRILGELAERDDVIALAMHVDYWDYLGWKDKFADPAHTKRQRAYARAAGERTIYTPQMVIGGQDHVVGSRPMKISNLVRKHAKKDALVEVRLTTSGNQIAIEATPAGTIRGGAIVQLVTYVPKSTVDIRRGENAGRTLTYHNIVRDVTVLGQWNGSGVYRGFANLPQDGNVVVLVQARNAGPILGAARLR